MKKFALPAVVLILFVISPIMAVPKTKSPLTARASLVAGNVFMGTQWITEDGTLHVKEAISVGTVTSISGADISGTLWTSLSGSGDLNTGVGSFHGRWAIITIDGSFEGNVVGVIIATSSTTSQISGTFSGYGTGGYAKQKIKCSFEGEAIMSVLQVEVDIEGMLTFKPE